MGTTIRAAAAAFLMAAGALAASPLLDRGGDVQAFPDHPPVAHTGGFGEPTCTRCHAGAAPNDAAGSLALRGAPEAYAPGGRYRIAVVLERAEMAAGGFQLAARCADGTQAGRLAAADPARVGVAEDGRTGVSYAHQTADGTAPARPGHAEWAVEWTAPAAGCGAVRFDGAANAGNGDGSALGDHVYTRTLISALSASR